MHVASRVESREDQQPQTILIVDSDESTRRILDLSLRHAGFNVGLAASGDEATPRLAERPDLVIAAADDADGLAFCRRAKQTGQGLPPAVVLISASDVESKRQGLEAGADDFIARPIYVQEVVARARALLQRRERERLEVSAQQSHRFVSAVENVPLVDLLRAIAGHQKSGAAQIVAASGARGEIFFRQGRVVDAEVGRISGREALYRLFCWTSGRLEVEWKSIRRKDVIEMPSQELLMEALRRVDEWRRLLADLPALDTVFEVEYRLLAERLADIPDEVNRILRLFDGVRTFLQVIDDCGLPDLDAVAAIGKLFRERIIRDARTPDEEDEAMVGADMEGWLSEAAGPFRSLPRAERDLFGAAPEAGAGVHGRPTAPLDPLGDGAPEVVDEDLRSRFTDRLVAESAAASDAAAPPAGDASDPSEGTDRDLSSTAPASLKPSTLPGMGAAAATDAGRAATTMAAQDGSAEKKTGEASETPGPSTLRGMVAASGASPPLDRRSASGEIFVKRAPPRALGVQTGEVRAAPIGQATAPAPAESIAPAPATGIVPPRPSYTTPPGSARALDEPPPLTFDPPAAAAAVTRTVDHEEEQLSEAEAADELGMRSRRRGLVVAASALLLLGGTVTFIAVRSFRARPGGASAELRASGSGSALAVTPTPAVAPTGPVVVPMGPKTPVSAPLGAAAGSSGAGARPASTGPVAEEFDERSADPKHARARAAEAGGLLSACNRAFSERRMKDAEAACVAARDANPESAEAYGLLAHALFNRSRPREALSAAERAVKLNPKWADAYVIIGGVHQDAGDGEQARRAYQKYLELEPRGRYAADLRAILSKLPAKL